MGFEIIGTDHLAPGSGVAAVLTAAEKISRHAADSDVTREAFAAAVGFYDCPCGSAFEFSEHCGLDEYAALNRWLGQHGLCDVRREADGGCADPIAEIDRLTGALEAKS